ncbi:MAG: bifunctional UDP-N-acetylglucosamine diphosphorylase/glucosamine-1-phosphate N-acetyltransferase GlmU [Luminiphilus sp.]|nr:bifunctional UDP-N-acetylglucosamine diphosphorylase/glucosamine-1-phosphate N-acetyltransferase GlmU [Luminiphilus sp.]
MLEVIILGAGKGTRMRSSLPKVLHMLAGKPLIHHVIDMTRQLGAANIHVVVGHDSDAVEDAIRAHDVCCHRQTEQLGTGHAVKQAIPYCRPESTVIVLFGDVPLLTQPTLASVVEMAASGPVVLAAKVEDPSGYGRVVRDGQGSFVRVVEHKDASEQERQLNEINTGVLATTGEQLASWLNQINNDNSQGEYYLPDVLAVATREGVTVSVVTTDSDEWLGVNDRVQLAQVERVLQAREADRLMAAGVGLADPARIDIRGKVTVGQDVFLDVGVVLEGEVSLGDNVRIEPYVVLRNCSIGSGTVINSFTHIEDASVGEDCQIGPYARLRPGSELAEGAKVGNFVELKNSQLGAGAKANHLAYVGDATVGAGSNIGAGTITCNYDGANKHKTTLGNRVFVGSNSTLVAPLTVADDSFVAAGSTVTSDISESQLAVGRAKQRIIDGWKRPIKKSRD